MATGQQHTSIVILGAGFGGVNVARGLVRLLPPEDDRAIVLVDQNNFMLFTPMLTEVAGDQVDSRDIVSAVRLLSPRVTFEQGRVEAIDLATRRVTLVTGGDEEMIPLSRRTLAADQLVIALGSVTAYHGIPGVEDYSLPMKTVDDALAIRNRALALLEYADAEPDPQRRRDALTFVVGGGGYSGVETMAALNDLVRDVAARYPHIQNEDVRMILVHPGKRLLPEISARLGAFAQRELEKRGVEVRLNTRIHSAGPDAVEFTDHERIPTRLLIWTAGVAPCPVVGTLDCRRNEHDAIIVDECCAVPGHPGVWALGDCAAVPRAGGTGTYGPTAQNAAREGTLVAHNIAAALQGQKPRPFVYHPIGELAIVGRRSGVASIYGLRFSGVVAWAMWRAIYLAKLPLMSKRIRVGLDWLLDLAFGREIAELPAGRAGARPGARPLGSDAGAKGG